MQEGRDRTVCAGNFPAGNPYEGEDVIDIPPGRRPPQQPHGSEMRVTAYRGVKVLTTVPLG